MSIISLVGGSGTVNAASGGKISPITGITTVTKQIAPANPARRRITFHNPTPAVDVYVYPNPMISFGNGYNNPGFAVTNYVPTGSLPGGSFLVVANGGTWVIDGECQGEWWAFTAAGTANLTVMDSNI